MKWQQISRSMWILSESAEYLAIWLRLSDTSWTIGYNELVSERTLLVRWVSDFGAVFLGGKTLERVFYRILLTRSIYKVEISFW